MAHDLHAVQLVVSLGAAADDPGGLAQADLAADHQRVDGAGAAVAAVVELVGLERVVVVEPVGPGDELGARPHLTAAEKGEEDACEPEATRRRYITVRGDHGNDNRTVLRPVHGIRTATYELGRGGYYYYYYYYYYLHPKDHFILYFIFFC